MTTKQEFAQENPEIRIRPNWNTYGPYSDRLHQEGHLESEGKTVGYWEQTIYDNGHEDFIVRWL